MRGRFETYNFRCDSILINLDQSVQSIQKQKKNKTLLVIEILRVRLDKQVICIS